MGALHPGGHLVGYHHGHVAAGRHGDELLGEAAEQARSLRELIKERPERSGHAVDDEEAEPGVVRQEAGHQVKLSQQLSVVMTTDLRENTQVTPQSEATVP